MKRIYRLRRNSDFQEVWRKGQSHANRLVVLIVARNDLEYSRFGFVANKRLGKAVQRNKIKRRMRAATRLRLAEIKPGFDVVMVARLPATQADYPEIERALGYLLKKAELLL